MGLAARPLVAQMVVVVMVAKQESAAVVAKTNVAKMDVVGIQITAVGRDKIRTFLKRLDYFILIYLLLLANPYMLIKLHSRQK